MWTSAVVLSLLSAVAFTYAEEAAKDEKDPDYKTPKQKRLEKEFNGFLEVEKKLIDSINNYVDLEKKRLDRLKSLAENSQELKLDYIYNPVNVFKLIKRLVYSDVFAGMHENSADAVVGGFKDGLPTEENLRKAAVEVFRWQDKTEAKVKDLANGDLPEKKSIKPLTSELNIFETDRREENLRKAAVEVFRWQDKTEAKVKDLANGDLPEKKSIKPLTSELNIFETDRREENLRKAAVEVFRWQDKTEAKVKDLANGDLPEKKSIKPLTSELNIFETDRREENLRKAAVEVFRWQDKTEAKVKDLANGDLPEKKSIKPLTSELNIFETDRREENLRKAAVEVFRWQDKTEAKVKDLANGDLPEKKSIKPLTSELNIFETDRREENLRKAAVEVFRWQDKTEAKVKDLANGDLPEKKSIKPLTSELNIFETDRREENLRKAAVEVFRWQDKTEAKVKDLANGDLPEKKSIKPLTSELNIFETDRREENLRKAAVEVFRWQDKTEAKVKDLANGDLPEKKSIKPLTSELNIFETDRREENLRKAAVEVFRWQDKTEAKVKDLANGDLPEKKSIKPLTSELNIFETDRREENLRKAAVEVFRWQDKTEAKVKDLANGDLPEKKSIKPLTSELNIFKTDRREENLRKAAVEVFRWQDKTEAKVKDLANGDLPEKKSIKPLTIDDCFHLGRMAYNDEDYYHAALWMEEAWERIQLKKTATNKEKVPILDYLSFCYYKMGNIQRAYWMTKFQILEMDPENTRAVSNLGYYKEEMAEAKMKVPEKEEELPKTEWMTAKEIKKAQDKKDKEWQEKQAKEKKGGLSKPKDSKKEPGPKSEL